jgi:DNA-directed RNA polymerase specialized sigma24 family protein
VTPWEHYVVLHYDFIDMAVRVMKHPGGATYVDRQDVSDVVQDTVEKLLRYPPAHNSWNKQILFRAARNSCVDYIRRRHGRNNRGPHPNRPSPVELKDTSFVVSDDRVIESRERLRQVLAAVDSLDERYRTRAIMRLVGYTIDEILEHERINLERIPTRASLSCWFSVLPHKLNRLTAYHNLTGESCQEPNGRPATDPSETRRRLLS